MGSCVASMTGHMVRSTVNLKAAIDFDGNRNDTPMFDTHFEYQKLHLTRLQPDVWHPQTVWPCNVAGINPKTTSHAEKTTWLVFVAEHYLGSTYISFPVLGALKWWFGGGAVPHLPSTRTSAT